MPSKNAQENWGASLGVILAVAGSAVGLGNFLRFPGQVALHGGGAFMIPYVIALFVIAIPLAMSEWALGRYAGRMGFHSPLGALYVAGGRKIRWGFAGCLNTFSPFVIAMYYIVIEAWCLAYAAQYLGGLLQHVGLGFSLFSDVAPGLKFDSTSGYEKFFGRLVGVGQDGSLFGVGTRAILWTTLACAAMNFILIYKGVSKGIERFCKTVAPLILLCAVAVIIRVVTLGNPTGTPGQSFIDGLGFMWNPTREIVNASGEVVGRLTLAQSLLNPEVWLAATAQIFFSTSICFGAICTYASYVKSRGDVALSSVSAVATNEFCEVVLGGLMTVPPAIMFLGAAASKSVGSSFALGFNVLPNVFGLMPMGQLCGFVLFTLLFLAAITSSVSMVQPAVALFQDSLHWGRKQSAVVVSSINLLGTAIVSWFTKDLMALDVFDFWVANLMPFLGGALQTCVVVFVWGDASLLAELKRGARINPPQRLGGFLKYVSFPYLLLVFGFWAWKNMADRVEQVATQFVPKLSVLFMLSVLAAILLLGFVSMKRWTRLDSLEPNSHNQPQA